MIGSLTPGVLLESTPRSATLVASNELIVISGMERNKELNSPKLQKLHIQTKTILILCLLTINIFFAPYYIPGNGHHS